MAELNSQRIEEIRQRSRNYWNAKGALSRYKAEVALTEHAPTDIDTLLDHIEELEREVQTRRVDAEEGDKMTDYVLSFFEVRVPIGENDPVLYCTFCKRIVEKVKGLNLRLMREDAERHWCIKHLADTEIG